jgi:hypothetical protein
MAMDMKGKKPAISISMISMPKKGEDQSDIDMAGEKSGEMGREPSESPADPIMKELEKFSDEDLMAEVERRGLASQLSQSSGEEKSEDGEEEEEEKPADKYEYS